MVVKSYRGGCDSMASVSVYCGASENLRGAFGGRGRSLRGWHRTIQPRQVIHRKLMYQVGNLGAKVGSKFDVNSCNNVGI